MGMESSVCTIVLLRRPGHAWPLLLAANRDEMLNRAWRPPGRHWPGQPDVVAGLDESAGGTWLGLNDAGVVAAVSNRRGALGPAPGLRSRGELPLAALAHGDARSAADALAVVDAAAYRTFNLVIADARDAFWLCNRGGGAAVERAEMPLGLSMLTAADIDDPTSARIRHYRPRFDAAAPPDPDHGDWADWQGLLASREGSAAGDPQAAMTVVTDTGFATVSSSLIALPGGGNSAAQWLFAPGRPDETPYAPVTL